MLARDLVRPTLLTARLSGPAKFPVEISLRPIETDDARLVSGAIRDMLFGCLTGARSKVLNLRPRR